jgi:hypothetical protein
VRSAAIDGTRQRTRLLAGVVNCALGVECDLRGLREPPEAAQQRMLRALQLPTDCAHAGREADHRRNIGGRRQIHEWTRERV